MIEGFKKFIMRGNVMDLAVGIIIGAAVTAIVEDFGCVASGRIHRRTHPSAAIGIEHVSGGEHIHRLAAHDNTRRGFSGPPIAPFAASRPRAGDVGDNSRRGLSAATRGGRMTASLEAWMWIDAAGQPRRKSPHLIEGTAFVTHDGFDMVRMEGELSKHPSFWTRRVEISRRYARVCGVRVPIEMQSPMSASSATRRFR